MMSRFTFLCAIAVLLVSQASAAHIVPPIRVNVDAMPINLEPPQLTDTITAWLLHHIADRLIEEDRPGQLQGNIASKWNISEDKKHYRFWLRGGEKFGDGSPLTAKDVVSSLTRAKKFEDKSRVGFYLKNISHIDAIDDHTIEIVLKSPTSNFLQILSDASFSIYKPCATKWGLCYTGDFDLVDVSSDAVEMLRRRDGQIFRLEKLSFVDAAKHFKEGSLEVLRTYGLENLALARTISDRRVIMPDERSFFFSFNSKSKIFSSFKNRQAVASHIDFEEVEKLLAAQGLQRSETLLSPSLTWGYKNLIQQSKPRSLTPQGTIPKFSVLMMKAHKLEPLAEAAFKKMGAKLESVEKAEFLSRLRSGKYDVLFVGYGITIRDWDYLSTLFHSDSSHNMIKLSSPEVDAWLSQAREEIDPAKRIEIYSRILAKNHENLWYVPLTHVPLIFALSPRISINPPATETTVTAPFFYLDALSWKN